MPDLTKNGRTITVTDSQAGFYRRRGWVDPDTKPSMSQTKPELVDQAVAAGTPRDEAEAATKAEIVEDLT